MSKQQQNGQWILRNTAKDNDDRYFEDEESAKETKAEIVAIGAKPENLEIIPPSEAENTQESQDNGESLPSKEAEVITQAVEESKSDATQGDTLDLPEQQGLENIPKISPIEEQTRSVIRSLDHGDMNRLVWDPDANPKDVPYNPKYLPYNRPEPSAEAFDMFSTIIEGVQDVQYSVEEVEFEKTDDTFECTVVVEKQTPNGVKKLPGFKTRERGNGPGIDHWRERLFSKARRNALKQDIPATWISALMEQYRGLENA